MNGTAAMEVPIQIEERPRTAMDNCAEVRAV